MTVATEHPHVVRDPEIISSGEPIINGTRTTVRAVAESWRMGMSPEEISNAMPHLNMAQIFDALSYFSDHTDEIMAHIIRNRIPEELVDPLVKNL